MSNNLPYTYIHNDLPSEEFEVGVKDLQEVGIQSVSVHISTGIPAAKAAPNTVIS